MKVRDQQLQMQDIEDCRKPVERRPRLFIELRRHQPCQRPGLRLISPSDTWRARLGIKKDKETNFGVQGGLRSWSLVDGLGFLWDWLTFIGK